MTKEKMEYKEHTRKEIEESKETFEAIMTKVERIRMEKAKEARKAMKS